MSRKVLAPVAFAVAALVVAAAPSARPTVAKKHVTIVAKAGDIDAFVLTWGRGSSAQRDSGGASWCCWKQQFLTRDGQTAEVNDPLLTLTGKRGELVLRLRIEWLDAGNSYSIGPSTWRVVRGTGAYKKVTGSGRGASSWLPNGPVSWRSDGFFKGGGK